MRGNITEILYRIKTNITAIEGGDTRKPIIDEIEADFYELMELIKLFLISERDSYYGYFLMNLKFSANPFSNSIAGIKLNTFPPVFESNPLLLCKFTLKEIIYIVCHEIDHIVFNHPTEMVKANPEKNEDVFYLFNLAADASVNDRINHEIDKEKKTFMSSPEGLITSSVIAKMFNLKQVLPMENYAYYFSLIKDNKKKGEMPNSSNGQSSMMQKQNEKDGTEKTEPTESSDQGNESEGYITANNVGEITDHDWGSTEDAEDVGMAVRELVNASVSMMNDEKRGLMPGHFLSQVEAVNKPAELSWQAILKKYIGTISANKRKTRMRLNRRQPERFDLSGRVDDKVLKIAVAIDTSGSVDDHMIGKIFNEIFAILAKRKHEITVIECDAVVQRVYKARSRSDIKQKVAGRGGTRFTPVIEYVNDDKYFRDALLIYFTDGYGESKIPKPMTYRNIWVVFGDSRHLSLNESYGVALTLKD
jgi:predicted metal-dependent peptidase